MCGGIAQAVDSLAEADISCLGLQQLGEEIGDLWRQYNRLDAQINRRIARFDRERGYEATGALDMVSWLRNRLRLFGGAAADRVKVARSAEALPATTAALRAGEISQSHAAVIARTAETVGAEAGGQLEPLLLEAAAQSDPARLRVYAKLQAAARRPESLLEEAERQHQSRYLRLSRTESGMYSIDGLVDVEGGSLLETAFNAVMGPRHKADGRSEPQRRLDALLDIFKRFLDGSADQSSLRRVQAMRPHIIITAELSALQGMKQASPARLGNGEPIPHESLLRHMCDAALSLVVVDSEGHPVAATRETRTIPPSVRRAIAARTATCEVRGCERPAEWCDGHHLRWVSRGGRTSLTNVNDVCTQHHRLHHEGGWGFARGEDGKLDLSPPPARSPSYPGG